MTTDITWFSELGLKDLDRVGGKNASLGEMVQNLTSAGVQVPDGFATTADAYRRFLADSGLDQQITDRLVGLDTDDVTALRRRARRSGLWCARHPSCRPSKSRSGIPTSSW